MQTVLGAQAEDPRFEDTYKKHNPRGLSAEFDRFATFDLCQSRSFTSSDQDGIEMVQQFIGGRLKSLIPKIQERAGVIVEVERVVGLLMNDDKKGEWIPGELDEFPAFRAGEVDVGVQPSKTLPFEIHHGFNIWRSEYETEPPIPLDKLSADCAKLGIDIGGWFVFHDHRGVYWQYRSNCFDTNSDVEARAIRQHAILWDFLKTEHHDVSRDWSLKTIVEQIVGIWNMGS